MIREVIKYTFSFILLVLLQGLLLNNVALFGFITPYLYVLIILMLPFETPSWLVLIVSFMLGVSVDVFTSTLGIHLSATVFLGFARKYILKLIEPRGGYEFGAKPTFADMGASWFAVYAVPLVLLHHIALFFVESFKFSQFFSTFGRAIASAIFTLLVIVIFQLFANKPQKK